MLDCAIWGAAQAANDDIVSPAAQRRVAAYIAKQLNDVLSEEHEELPFELRDRLQAALELARSFEQSDGAA